MAAKVKVKETNEELFRKMEETSLKLMEEFKIQDSTCACSRTKNKIP